MRKLILILGITIPVFFVFKQFFISGPLAWGDAPYFYPEMLKELVNEPLAWTNRGFSFGGVNNAFWISPILIIYGLLAGFFGNNSTIRILFYFPSLMFAAYGTYLFTKYLKLSKTVQFFAVLIYLLNTYYLLLIDGGQVGVLLAYGLFPIALLQLKKLVDSPSIKIFYLSLTFLLLITIADPRVAAISLATVAIWSVLEGKIKDLIYLAPLTVVWLGLNMYWIYPILKNEISSSPFSSSELKIIKWYNPLLLFSPHWPANLFGKVVRPPLYFLVVPVIIFLGVFLKREKKFIVYSLLFLIIAFLSNGVPFIDWIPFGIAFRDSTKFFVPLILLGGILIGQTAERIQSKFKNNIIVILLYGYMVFLVNPALLGKMNFVLSNRTHSQDFQKIYENLNKDDSFFRTVWLPERNPLTYETKNHPAVDARDLAFFWPFAAINASEDVFNFLNFDNYADWFRVLGIKYLILSDNPREITKDQTNQKDWETIRELVASSKQLAKVDWGTQIPVYKVDNTYPRFYAVKQLTAIIGPSLVPSAYSLLPSVFFEDGKWDPRTLEGKDPSSVVLLFNGTDKTDLAMSFLQKYFISPDKVSKNEWATYSKDQYLKYKYELSIRGVKFTDFDYGKGISFSTIKGEEIEYNFEVPQDGEYVFAYRKMIPLEDQLNLRWKFNNLTLAKGKHREIVKNESDLSIVNAPALILKKDFDNAMRLADTFTKHFETIDEKDLKIKGDYKPVEIKNAGTLKYEFTMPEKYFWLIYSDNYNRLWKLRQGNQYSDSVPVYSMVNGFYAESSWSNIGIEFKGQENVRWGIYWSIVSTLGLSILYLWFSSKDSGKKNKQSLK